MNEKLHIIYLFLFLTILTFGNFYFWTTAAPEDELFFFNFFVTKFYDNSVSRA